MEKSAVLNITPKTDAECESVVDFYLSGMKLIQEQMNADQREIKSLRAETDAILVDIMQTLRAV